MPQRKTIDIRGVRGVVNEFKNFSRVKTKIRTPSVTADPKKRFFAQKQRITLVQFCISQRTIRPTKSTQLTISTKENFSRAEGSICGSHFFSYPPVGNPHAKQ